MARRSDGRPPAQEHTWPGAGAPSATRGEEHGTRTTARPIPTLATRDRRSSWRSETHRPRPWPEKRSRRPPQAARASDGADPPAVATHAAVAGVTPSSTSTPGAPGLHGEEKAARRRAGPAEHVTVATQTRPGVDGHDRTRRTRPFRRIRHMENNGFVRLLPRHVWPTSRSTPRQPRASDRTDQIDDIGSRLRRPRRGGRRFIIHDPRLPS